jgi:predicted Zn-dependent protease
LINFHGRKCRLALADQSQAAILLIALCGAGLSPSLAQSTESLPIQASAQLPALGDGSDMSSSAERRLGERIAREIYRDPDYIDDPVLAEYVQGVWQPLLAAARLRGDLSPELSERFAWEIMMGRDRSVNAFALPGGYFGLHLGLLAVVSSRDELASVLGHELSHVTQRHISRMISKQGQQAPWMIGAMILGALAASKNAEVANAMIVGSQAANAQSQLNFSRDMEREADRVGFGVMTQAGFEAQGFVTMFDKLQQASRLNDNGAYPYLRSHPLTTERIADMQSRQVLGFKNQANLEPTLEHAMLAARARVLSHPGVDALRAVALEAGNPNLAALTLPRQVAVLYGAALAASRLRDFGLAADTVDRLMKLLRADDGQAARWARLLRVELALAGGNAAGAAAALSDSLSKSGPVGSSAPAPGRPELFLSAQIALLSSQSGQLAQVNAVAQRLQVWVATHPVDAQAWQLLSSTYAAQGQTLRAIRADAETRVAQLDYAAALDRFKAAQDFVRKGGAVMPDHIEASIIDTRRRQVESVLKEQALDR